MEFSLMVGEGAEGVGTHSHIARCSRSAVK
jgi:hypothetical protein